VAQTQKNDKILFSKIYINYPVLFVSYRLGIANIFSKCDKLVNNRIQLNAVHFSVLVFLEIEMVCSPFPDC